MNATLQAILVSAVVAVAAGHAALKLMPAAWRTRLAKRAATVAGSLGASDASARRVEAKLATGGACGSCDTCKACAAPTATATGADRHIPIRPMR